MRVEVVADLTIQLEEVENASGVSVLSLRGSIDAKTVFEFQKRLGDLTQEGHRRFVLDMEEVKYMNSAGLGFLINLADELAAEGGEIALVGVQPKVRSVLEMLGLNSFFRIFRGREEAIAYLKGGAAPDAQTVVIRKGTGAPAVAGPPRRAPLPAAPERRELPKPEPKPQPKRENDVAAGTAPASVACAGCGAPLAIREPGWYRCPKCLGVTVVGADGKVSGVQRRRNQPVQVTFEVDSAYVAGFLALVEKTARAARLNEDRVRALAEAARLYLEIVREQAYGGNARGVVQALVGRVGSEVEVKIAHSGKAIPADGEAFEKIRGLVVRFDYARGARGGGVLTIAQGGA